MRNYKVILFDLDGTITDTKEGIINSFKSALSKFNIEEKNTEKLLKFIGPPLKNSFKSYNLDEKNVKLAIDYYREYYSDRGIYENKIYDEILNLLEYLKSKGKIMILATSKLIDFAEQILENLKIHKYFYDIVGSNFEGTMVEKSDIISHIINKYSLNKDEIIMIGDREFDIIGANNNNIDSVAVLYGFGDIDELKKHNPTYMVGNVNELKSIL